MPVAARESVRASNLSRAMRTLPGKMLVCGLAALAVVPAGALAAKTPKRCMGKKVTVVPDGPKTGKLFKGTNADDVIATDRGKDIIATGGGDDVICVGKGRDLVNAGPGDDIISGGDNADILKGAAGNDTITTGADQPNGIPDLVDAGGGDDVVISDIDGAIVKTAAGDDVVKVARSGNSVASAINLIDLGAGNDRIEGAQTSTQVQAAGGVGNDTLISGANADALKGEAGDDTLQSGAGGDALDGGGGNDSCDGGADGEGTVDVAADCERLTGVP